MDDEEAIPLAEVTCILGRALMAFATGDVEAMELFTDDVIGDGPNLHVRSQSELQNQLLDRAGALSNVAFSLDQVDVVGPKTFVASWRVAGDHTGPLMLNEDLLFEPSGRRIDLSVTTRVVVRGRRIAEFQAAYVDGDPVEQIRGLSPSPDER